MIILLTRMQVFLINRVLRVVPFPPPPPIIIIEATTIQYTEADPGFFLGGGALVSYLLQHQ